MAEKLFISVVIPTYNRAATISSTVQAVLEQTYANREVIIVDDGSTDNTAEVLSAFGDAVTVIHQENKGITGARNTGIRASKGDWIALQDSDDHWDPDKLQMQVDDINAHPGLDVYLTNARLQRNHIGEEVGAFEYSGFSKSLEPCFTVLERPLISQLEYGIAWAQCALVRREYFFDAGLYDEALTIFTDVDMFTRLAVGGRWGVNCKTPVVIQRVESEEGYVSAQRKENPERPITARLKSLRKIQNAPALNEEERKFVRGKIAATLRQLGNWHRESGAKKDARGCYKKAFQEDRSIKSALRYASTLAAI